MTEYEQVVEALSQALCRMSDEGMSFRARAKSILSELKHPNGEPMLLVGAQDQSWPEPYLTNHPLVTGWRKGQESMSDFRRIVEERWH